MVVFHSNFFKEGSGTCLFRKIILAEIFARILEVLKCNVAKITKTQVSVKAKKGHF